MDTATAHFAIKTFLKDIRERLDKAARVAKAAEACAEADVDKGVQIALDLEQSLYEASRLLDAVSLIGRLSQR